MNQGTSVERAAAVSAEAMRRGLWTTDTGLAFVTYAGNDLSRVEFWENTLTELADAEEEANIIQDQLEELQDQFDNLTDSVRDIQNRFQRVEVNPVVINELRTGKWGK